MSVDSTINHRYIWQLAGPMIIANISVPLLGMVDTAVVGHLDSPHYLAAVALASVIFSFLFWGFGFLRMATTGLVAQAQGRDDNNEQQSILQQGLLLAIVIASILLLCQQPISQFAFYILESSSEVLEQAKLYFSIRIWSSPAILLNYVVLGWLIGKGATRAALLLIIVVNVSNILLDFALVNGLGLKVNGVALASVIAEYLGLIVSIQLLIKDKFNLKRLWRFERARQLFNKSWLSLNSNIFIRTLCLIFSFAFFTAQGAKQGDVILAANALLLNFITFMAFVLDGFANATEVISGKAIGANNPKLLKKGLVLTGLWSAVIALLFSLIYSLFGNNIINLLSNINEIRSVASDYLIWLTVIPLVAVWSYLFDGLFIGAVRSKEMRNTMLFATCICYLPAWYFLQHYGNHGLWCSLLIFLAARSFSQALYIPAILKPK